MSTLAAFAKPQQLGRHACKHPGCDEKFKARDASESAKLLTRHMVSVHGVGWLVPCPYCANYSAFSVDYVLGHMAGVHRLPMAAGRVRLATVECVPCSNGTGGLPLPHGMLLPALGGGAD